MGILELSFLTRRLPAFLKNRSTPLIESPKCYIIDSGVAAHRAGIADLNAQSDPLLRGALFETCGRVTRPLAPEVRCGIRRSCRCRRTSWSTRSTNGTGSLVAETASRAY
jgi:hypothetical protein